ncbi:MAG: metalloprotease PmbA [Gammaproteobacteria bacterium]|nr:metalloprotease PmbA [Gammaproteobacteria bacterium]
MTPQLQRLESIITFILSLARSHQATQAEASAEIETGFSVTVHQGKPETIEYESNNAIDITVYFDQRKASVSTSDMSENSLKKVVEKACNIAKFTDSDPCAGLADASLMCAKPIDLDLYYPWHISPEQAIDLALQCEAIGLNTDKRIKRSEEVMISTGQHFYCYGNTHGFIGTIPSTRHLIDCNFIAEEKGQMERDFSFTLSRDPKDLASVQAVAKDAAHRSVNRLLPQKLKTQKVPVIFEARAAKNLLGAFVSAVSGNALYRKASFLLDSLDLPIFPDFVQIHEEPYLKKGLGSTFFDAEGVVTAPKYFIKNGCLESYVLNSYSARKLNMQTTGNAGGVFNLMIDPNDLNLDQLMKMMGKGLLITELIGQGINLVTGDYSRGAFGFWIENGHIQYPVSGITIAGNLRDMFKGIMAISNDIEKQATIQTGSIFIDQMTVAGE